MVRLINILIVVLGFANIALAQGQLELYRGNQAFTDGNMVEAKSHYEQSLVQNPNSFEGTYNLGSTSYKNESFEEAITQYQDAASQTSDPELQARALHNLGNAYLQGQKLDESIKAYKQALRLNPSDNETRYNLAYALKMKKEQEQQEQEQEQNQDQDQENQDQQDKQDKQDKEEKEEEQEKDEQQEQDQEQEEEEKEENQDGQGEENEGDEEEEQKAQPKPLELTPREAEQMLDAARNEDQKIQMMLKKQQKSKNKNIDKDW